MQAQARDKREEGKRNKARGTALAASIRCSEDFSGGGTFEAAFGAAEMNAKEIVLEELKSGKSSYKLEIELSLLTSL